MQYEAQPYPTATTDAAKCRKQCDAYQRRIVELEQQVNHLRDVLVTEAMSCLPLRMFKFEHAMPTASGLHETTEVTARTRDTAVELFRRRHGDATRIACIDGVPTTDDGKTVKYTTGGKVES